MGFQKVFKRVCAVRWIFTIKTLGFYLTWIWKINHVVGYKIPGAFPMDFPQARLRALCDRHGWEFEWMTEDVGGHGMGQFEKLGEPHGDLWL